MKRGAAGWVWLVAVAALQADPARVVERVIDALVVVESGGRADAVGDGGRAVGVLQIWPVTVREANRLLGREQWTLADRRDPQESRAMARVILSWHYRRGAVDPVELGCRWRNPFSTCPEWYRAKVRRALEATQTQEGGKS